MWPCDWRPVPPARSLSSGWPRSQRPSGLLSLRLHLLNHVASHVLHPRHGHLQLLRLPLGVARSSLPCIAARPPHLPNLEANIGDLPDAQLISELRDRYNGIPPAVLAHPELLGLVLPLLRADIRLYEDYRHTPALPLHLPLAAYGGSLDPIVSPESLSNWQVHTAGPFQTRRFNGEHFFLQSDAAAVIGAAKRFFLDAVP